MSNAAYLTGIRKIEIGTLDKVSCNGVKIKVNSCALCGSDIRIFNSGNDRVEYPAIIGHEVSGTIVESYSDEFKVGENVSIGGDIPCGNCPECLNLKPNLCKKNLAIGYQLKGGFSEYMYLDKEIILNGPFKKIPKEFNLETACLAEPLACAFNGLEKMRINENAENLLIFGAGPIGIMLGILAKKVYKVKKIDFVELSEYRINYLKELDIANEIIRPEVLEKKFSKYKEKYQFVITACSVLKTHQLGISLLANGGSINFFGGLSKPSPSLPIVTNDIHYRELTLTGSHGSTPIQHSKAVEFIIKNEKLFSSLITHRFNLDKINDAFHLASRGEGIKIVIKP